MAFFEKIGGAITNSVNATATKTKEITEQSKLNSELSGKKKELNALYNEIGRVFVENSQADSLKELKGRAVVLFDEIDSLERKIADNKGQKKCEHCGELIDNASVFCAFCGGKQAEITNKCPKCKTILPQGTLYCVNCGTKQNVKADEQPRQQTASEPEIKPVVVDAPAEPEIVPVIVDTPAEPEALAENVQEECVFCSNCGKKLSAGVVFCTECGSKL